MSTTEQSQTSQQSVGDRPLPFRARRDLVRQPMGFQGESFWVIKDPVALKYHRLRPEQHRVLELMAQPQSLHDIRRQLRREYPGISVRVLDVQKVVADLHEKRLLSGDRPGQGPVLVERHRKDRNKQLVQALQNVLFLKLPGIDPQWFLDTSYPWLRWMFHPLCVWLGVLVISLALFLMTANFALFQRRLPEFEQFFGWPNLLWLWLAIAGTKVVHELGHALTCRHFGGRCHQIGVMVLVFSPTLYCDVTDSWMMPNKWHRMAIGVAGAFVESVLSALALGLWWFTEPGLVNHLCLNVAFIGAVSTVIFNLNPLVRFDGYYILSDWLEVPNLKQHSDQTFSRTFAWWVLGLTLPEEPFAPRRARFWYGFYAVASWCYRWVLVLSIAMFLHEVLKPYDLEVLAWSMAGVSVLTVLWGMGRGLHKILTTPRLEQVSRMRVGAGIAFLGVLAGLLLLVPIPWWVSSSFAVEPVDVRHVHTRVPGTIRHIAAQPGQKVAQGEVLLELENDELADKARQLRAEQQLAAIRQRAARLADDHETMTLLGDRLQALARQLEHVELQLSELTVVAPCAGTVVAAPVVAEPPDQYPERRVRPWWGTPLDERNLGATLEAATEVCLIAPGDEVQAVLFVDQDDRNDVFVGQIVRLKCTPRPELVLEGAVAEVSLRQSEYVPRELTNKAGGDLATVTDSQGRERLSSVAYRATVPLGEAPMGLATGMRGTARFIISNRSLANWGWRWLRQTLNFRL